MAKKIIEDLKKKFFNKKILIVGLGIQGGGVGLAKFFSELGSQVLVTDLRPKEVLFSSLEELKKYHCHFFLGEHPQNIFLEVDHIFIGPSIPWTLPQLQLAIKRGIPVEMETSFFVGLSQAKIIGVTGTRGKSTTATMIYEVLKAHNKPVYLRGLPGQSTVELLEKTDKNSYVVLELSSWQLSSLHKKRISPHVAVFTNFYPDHLNYYSGLDTYFYDKKAIYQYQHSTDYLIINRSLQAKIEKDKPESQILYFSKSDYPQDFLYLKGDHNRENAAASLLVSRLFGLGEKKTLETIRKFKGVNYRQEPIAKKNQVIFVNDTTSTTPIATIKAIEAFSDKPIILILGGNDKNLPVDNLLKSLSKIKKIVLLKGTFTDKILPALKNSFSAKITPVYDNLDDAVLLAYQEAKKENQEIYLLFSPSATSFSMFKNEFDRGEAFNRIVGKILVK